MFYFLFGIKQFDAFINLAFFTTDGKITTAFATIFSWIFCKPGTYGNLYVELL